MKTYLFKIIESLFNYDKYISIENIEENKNLLLDRIYVTNNIFVNLN